MQISVVSPVYNAENILAELVKRIDNSVSKITNNYEIILVEDCGPDSSWDIIEEIAYKNTRVKGFKLSRNFGQHYAITCGLDNARGEWIVEWIATYKTNQRRFLSYLIKQKRVMI